MAPTAGLKVVYAVVFLAFFDTFALLPTIGPYAATLGASSVGVGVAVGAYSASNIVFNVIGGFLLDHVGRRRVVIAGLCVAIAGVVAYGFVSSPEALVGARLLHGAGGGVVVPALFTLAGDLSPAQRRGPTMGRVGAFIGLAAVVGPGVAGPVRAVAGFGAVFMVVAAVLALATILTALRVVDVDRESPQAPIARLGVHQPRTNPRWSVVVAIVAVFGFTSTFATLASFLGLRVEPLVGNPAVTGMLFAMVSGIAAILMLTPVARWVDRSGVVPPVAAGMALFVAATTALATTSSIGATIIACAVFGVGFGVLFPAATAGVAGNVRRGRRGRAFGWFNAAYSLGFVIGGPAAGAVSAAWSTSVFTTPAVICGVVGLVAIGRLRRPARPSAYRS